MPNGADPVSAPPRGSSVGFGKRPIFLWKLCRKAVGELTAPAGWSRMWIHESGLA